MSPRDPLQIPSHCDHRCQWQQSAYRSSSCTMHVPSRFLRLCPLSIGAQVTGPSVDPLSPLCQCLDWCSKKAYHKSPVHIPSECRDPTGPSVSLCLQHALPPLWTQGPLHIGKESVNYTLVLGPRMLDSMRSGTTSR